MRNKKPIYADIYYYYYYY